MATDLNRVLLYGRVLSPPEVSTGPEQKLRARFVFATRSTWKDRETGGRRSASEHHDVVVANHALAGIVAEHVSEGTRLFLEGSLRSRWVRGTDGEMRKVVEVVLGPFKSTLELLDDAPEPEDAEE